MSKIYPKGDWSLPSSLPEKPLASKRSFARSLVLVVGVTLATLIVSDPKLQWARAAVHHCRGHKDKQPICAQQQALFPKAHSELLEKLNEIYAEDDFIPKAAKWLGDAVKIPTESYDHMLPVGQDPRWDIFSTFHKHLETAFPKVHEHFRLTKVNTYGLVYRWVGSNETLKPILLTAHQDVVPVNPDTVSEWVHPPYSGLFDGTYVWGRGSGDDKSSLISTLIAFENLIDQGFQPTRTIFIGSGFDEEAWGTYGSAKIAEYLLSTYGEDYFGILVDEGGGHASEYGIRVAAPGIGEKGNTDIRIEISSPGGHSSVPPQHTSIGLLAAAIVHLEANPHPAHISRASPYYSTLLCVGEHAPDLPKSLKRNLAKSVHSDHALHRAEKELFASKDGKGAKALVGTTQAVDLIEGGVKVNALPEQASAIVNHRISTDSSIQELLDHFTDVMRPIAHKYNLAYEAFGVNISSPCHASSIAGSLRLTDWGLGLEPAPISPTDEAPYKLLAGTIRATWESGLGKGKNESIIVAPGMMTGNTDTRYFWKLTRHIFRYNHQGAEDTYPGGGIHTVNEAVRVDAFIDQIRFFTYLILNSDESLEF